MSKPKPPKHHIAVRLDEETAQRLDALLPVFTTPGRDGTRSDVLRAVILFGLKHFEHDPEGSMRELMGPDGGG